MKFVKHMIKFHDRMMVKIICCLDVHSGLLAGICTKVKYTSSSHSSSICMYMHAGACVVFAEILN